MSVQSLENYNRRGRAGRQATHDCEEEYAFLVAANVEIRLRLRSFANSRKHGLSRRRRMMRNNEDAEDVVQESFQQAFIHLKSFNGDSGFRRGCRALPSMLP